MRDKIVVAIANFVLGFASKEYNSFVKVFHHLGAYYFETQTKGGPFTSSGKLGEEMARGEGWIS